MSKKYKHEACDNSMTFQECELTILRIAVDETEKLQKQKIVNSEQVQTMIKILEEFLIRKKLICYGGTAINNILPKFAQFYNRDIEIPDYDFFSPNALEDAKELADIYYSKGYSEVEAKAGMHYGTFKVFVNFIPIADITLLHKSLYNAISKEAITVAGIKYAPPNYLRMSMFLELSRPAGDVSRWEKVLKRLTLLNDYYPLKPTVNCNTVDFQRKMEVDMKISEKLYFIIRDSFIEQGVIFFGGYASSLYARYMPKNQRKLVEKIPDFDVISEEPEKCAMIVTERLNDNGFKNVKNIHHEAIGEIVPPHIEIKIGNETLAFIYAPIACHSYNKINIGNREVNVATIDTILSLYLAFYYANQPYYYKDRIICMAKFLFDVEQKNRLEQKGLLKRFSINCYGKQETIEDIRSHKVELFNKLKNNKKSKEYEMGFLKYNPSSSKKTQKNVKKSKKKNDENGKIDEIENDEFSIKKSQEEKIKKKKKNITRKQKVSKDFLF